MDVFSVLGLLLLSVGGVYPGFIITAERGQNVSLTCDLPDPDGAGVLEWTRADLKEAYVFRDRTPDPDLQHPSFRNRVSLQDGPMWGPDRSVVLQEVTLDDSGTYECRVLHGGPDSGPISTVQLVVVPELEVIHAQSGQSVTLPCRAPGADPQADIRWSKHDLEPEEVLLIEGGVVQHPTIRDRVTVGHLSITLKNVVLEDSGTYRCRVVRRPAARRRRSGPDRDHVTSVYLSVSPAAARLGQQGGAADGLPPAVVGGAFGAGLVLGAAAAGLAVFTRRRSRNQNLI
ncbi:cell surface A33 antigen [Oryzias latipes]|uniref:cell surface A33 antigen n=1 Tax=Oryzias latipes TaxID=8090 RepID=UPI0002A48550|nr:cell surface A33 antigen [Oryzias latipes]